MPPAGRMEFSLEGVEKRVERFGRMPYLVSMIERSPPFTCLDGSLEKEEERFRRLLNAPHSFSNEELDQLLERFQDRLDRGERFDLIVKRIRLRDYENALEKKALLAAIEGTPEEAEKFRRLLRRRNELNLKVLSGGPKAPPR